MDFDSPEFLQNDWMMFTRRFVWRKETLKNAYKNKQIPTEMHLDK